MPHAATALITQAVFVSGRSVGKAKPDRLKTGSPKADTTGTNERDLLFTNKQFKSRVMCNPACIDFARKHL
ncbi:MAG: hypothetical protein R6V12_13225, partial [Candidatus Hydrogenedentota bacterium]